KAVRQQGDRAVLRFTKRFDRLPLKASELRVPQEWIKRAYQELKPEQIESLEYAADRIAAFHIRQRQTTWTYDEDGITLGQQVRPLATVGLYVPGGKAAYPSSVLMNAIPAKIAGVERIVISSPTPAGELNPALLVAADLAGVHEIYRVGGAQAIGAMAFGTETIPRVDKIVGPGNQYVALAKRLVYGVVDIDLIAGPSEIVVIADDSADPRFVAADLLSQAEHDEKAMAMLLTPSAKLARRVQTELAVQLRKLPRRKIATASLESYGAIVLVRDLQEAVELANQIAPEHLELEVEDPRALLARVKNAGAVFLGHYSPQALGDYIAGPNHVLPTGGTARFSSPLSLDDFVKKTSLIEYSKEGLRRAKEQVIRIASMEGLDGHWKAVEIRMR
ncbi:MAG TPA: histidinol dehydrogenase, partial [Nitrospiria bacterium]|nr:histidinol dehydrogenase [Nitrospiria bacterium]